MEEETTSYLLVGFIEALLVFPFLFTLYSIWRRKGLFLGRNRWDTLFLLVNGVAGIVGIPLCLLNVLANVEGNVVSWGEIDDCERKCSSFKRLHAYIAISSFRFFAWYLEYVVAFLRILLSPVSKQEFLFFLVSRYFLHLSVLALSSSVVYILLTPSFPTDSVYGSSILRPIYLQCVIVLYVLFSFYSIFVSPLYQFSLNIKL